ncbi:1-phosphofructokinase [Fusibacter ferrireducens]|uniref:Tagatose-6-phosphate kinase n=1 Tax=Fusibacter ferrireducens TaxID=2785058 RepID=A0ABR9ZRL1_9FIRM|nr:1-phosphofructokinase [Fusibacter ferrireducens]MBF4692565.1 1-phosphofructokinase [Fusibacter ferrireducens]
MILTVTLNPAIDRTIEIENLEVDKVNRTLKVRKDIGGKGINVSKTILAMGGDSLATIIVGGPNGDFILKEAQQMGLKTKVILNKGNTRENIKIVDVVNKTYTDINEPGPDADEAVEEEILSFIGSTLSENDFLVLSGSSLKGLSDDIFNKMVEKANQVGAYTMVDVEGEKLRTVIESKPSLIKPNIHELEALFNTSITRIEEVVSYAQKLIEKGLQTVVVSMGEKGLLWIDENTVYLGEALKVDVKSTVGAGDAIVAGLAKSLNEKRNVEETLRVAISAASCVIETEGSKTGNMASLNTYISKVDIVKLV